MDRRTFLFAGAAGTAGAVGAGALGSLASLTDLSRTGWIETTPVIDSPGMREGHALRDRRSLPAPSGTLETDIAILGAGAAGLSCAWQLARAGHKDFVVLAGPEFGGNAAGGRFGELGYPKGAHYLPLPSMESTHLRDMLADFGVIEADPFTARPVFDERVLVHAPDERLLIDGQWQDGLVPTLGVDHAEIAQQQRFFAYTDTLRTAVGSDGRKVFCIPLAQSSQEPRWRALDKRSFKQWLVDEGYTAPSLHWYLNYACRDDFGAGYEHVSAWAGLHYFSSRGGHARNAEDGAVLTWPDGLHGMVTRLSASITQRVGKSTWSLPGFAARVDEKPGGVEVLCVRIDSRNVLSTFVLKARRVVSAMPLFVAQHVMPHLSAYGFDASRDLPPRAPWLVSNFLMDGMPREAPGVPLAWDNVVYRGEGLGYVVSTHQLIRLSPPQRSVFSAYQALDLKTPDDTRRWLAAAHPDDLRAQAAIDLLPAYGRDLWRHAAALEITVRGHAMATPDVGFLSRPGLLALRDADGPVLFAHADLSGMSLFEEASYWGVLAAHRALG
ncbi:FAD-dependent oxidoreductase [Paraburkholderia bryophila]|uniref:Putative NAD(P)-binding protein n=1 Tax=Paraburkholderia bryophila TaxID=420952 RepID=A0A329BET2_9BURK|nr:FAD-dependent oxidoreductase [Paraburkholderia bryophila]RAS20829.1 putative NAD(P)-binding protein [Paraburkholderia bryophila]